MKLVLQIIIIYTVLQFLYNDSGKKNFDQNLSLQSFLIGFACFLIQQR